MTMLNTGSRVRWLSVSQRSQRGSPRVSSRPVSCISTGVILTLLCFFQISIVKKVWLSGDRFKRETGWPLAAPPKRLWKLKQNRVGSNKLMFNRRIRFSQYLPHYHNQAVKRAKLKARGGEGGEASEASLLTFSRSPSPFLLNLSFCTRVQFCSDSIRMFNDWILNIY